MGKKKRLILWTLLIFVLTAAVGAVSFHLGRRGQTGDGPGSGTDGKAEAGKGEDEAPFLFGSSSVAAAPCRFDGTACDFSFEEAPASMTFLADRLVPELKSLEEVADAAAFYRRSGAKVYHGIDGLQTGTVLGTGTGFLSASGFQVEKGRGFTEKDLEEKRRVALLDGRAAQALFPGTDPVGETIEVEERLYQVVGVIDLSEARAGGGLVVVPESTWPEIYQYEEPKSVVLRLSEPEAGTVTEEEWERLREAVGLRAARMLNSMLTGGEGLRYAVW